MSKQILSGLFSGSGARVYRRSQRTTQSDLLFALIPLIGYTAEKLNRESHAQEINRTREHTAIFVVWPLVHASTGKSHVFTLSNPILSELENQPKFHAE